ncbi:MAG: sigma-54-dependent transcriptional regulator [Myxococcota bacterium]
MSGRRHALVVEDDADAREALSALLEAHGFRATPAETLAEARARLDEGHAADLIMLDLGLPDGDGMELLGDIEDLPGRRAVIVLTGERRLERAVEAMRSGAFDYLPKPLSPEALEIALQRLEWFFESTEAQRNLRRQLARAGRFQGMVGRSRAMQEVYALVERVAPSRLPVFVRGESGTGKELLARAVHDLSPRKRRPFVAINCGAIPASLVESELFGHERGAFTGATARHDGVFRQADGGTLFLDELPEMPQDTQVKLLRVLESGTVRRVGGREDLPVDVRIVSATNRHPEEAVREGLLREDLFFRLHVVPVTLPPLRERRADVPLLAETFLEAATEETGTPVASLTPAAVEALKAWHWPGNVRELRNVMARAALLSGGEPITPAHLGLPAAPSPTAAGGPARSPGDAIRVPVGATLREAERLVVEAYLERFRGHRARTARALGITPKTLYNKCKTWGLDPDRWKG